MKKEKTKPAGQAATDGEKELQQFTDHIRQQLEDSGYEYLLVVSNTTDNITERRGLLGLKGNVSVLAEMVFSVAEQGEKAIQRFVEHIIYYFAKTVSDASDYVVSKENDTFYS